MAAQFGDVGVKAGSGKKRCDFASESARARFFTSRTLPQDFADFLFHASAVPAGTLLQAALD